MAEKKDLELLEDITTKKSKTNNKKDKNTKQTNNTDIDVVLAYDKRLPLDINPNYKFIPLEQFIERANSNDGILIENKLYINLDVINKDLYDALKNDLKEDFMVLYKFDDQIINLTFIDNNKVKIYKSKR